MNMCSIPDCLLFLCLQQMKGVQRLCNGRAVVFSEVSDYPGNGILVGRMKVFLVEHNKILHILVNIGEVFCQAVFFDLRRLVCQVMAHPEMVIGVELVPQGVEYALQVSSVTKRSASSGS